MTNNSNLPEILAPAGSMEGLTAAVRCGADGVYVGGKNFSARANAVNFSAEELAQAAEYCHLHGVKIYRAMNTVIFDGEREEFLSEVRYCAEIGIDGLIIQDIGAARIAAEAVPDMPRHASTQMTVHTPLGAKAAERMGFCRVVPARELTKEQIGLICDTGIETEVFVHGAQCMSLSGQCYMSALIGSRSANRGQCAQACRLPFSAFGQCGEDSHALSLKDMSLLYHTDELAAEGAVSFKIEGRMKRPEYIAAAVTAFRHAADGKTHELDGDMQRLEAVFSRSGFTDGYLTGNTGADMFGSRRKEDVVSANDVLPELALLYKNEKKIGRMDMTLTVRTGKESELSYSVCGVQGYIAGKVPEVAIKRSITAEDAEKQLIKLGDTPFEVGELHYDIDGGLMLPASELNRMRRAAADEAVSVIIKQNTPVYSIDHEKTIEKAPKKAYRETASHIPFRLRADRADIIIPLADRAEMLILPINECEKLTDGDIIGKTAVSLPMIVTDEERLKDRIAALMDKGFIHFYCECFTHAGVLMNGGFEGIIVHGGTGMNITNSTAVNVMKEMGFADGMFSFEMKSGQIASAEKPIPMGIYAYGKLPLMTVKNCPVKAERGCGKCAHRITDRTGRQFPVHCTEGYSVIRNCDVLETSDRLSDFGGISFAVLDFGGNDIDEKAVASVLRRYSEGGKPHGAFTRGLYSRGVI